MLTINGFLVKPFNSAPLGTTEIDVEIYKLLCNGNRTEWSTIRSVIIRVITKSDDRTARLRFVYHEYDYRPNWTTRSLITN